MTLWKKGTSQRKSEPGKKVNQSLPIKKVNQLGNGKSEPAREKNEPV